MASPTMSGQFQVGIDVLGTTVSNATGKILAQTGSNNGQGQTDADNVVWQQHVGFASRPAKPEKGKAAAQAFVIRQGGQDVAIGSQDLRELGRYGNLDDGETCVYAVGPDGTGQARAIFKKDGSINLLTTDTNADGGNSVNLRVAPDGLTFAAPWGTLRFDATGFHVNHAAGAQLGIGGIYGLPAPLDQISSYVRMQASTFNANVSASSFGGDAGHFALANSTAVMAALAALQAQVTAMSVAWAALGALTGPIAGAAVAPIATPVATAASTNTPLVAAATNPATSLIPTTAAST